MWVDIMQGGFHDLHHFHTFSRWVGWGAGLDNVDAGIGGVVPGLDGARMVLK